MAQYITFDKEGREVEYGFAKFTRHFVIVWDKSDSENPIIVKNQFTGLNGKKLAEFLENELGVEIPTKRKSQMLMELPVDDDALDDQ